MIAFRDKRAEELGLDLIVHINQDGLARGINPFDHGSAVHTDVMKTEALKQALDKYKFDAAIGGARRGEEKSRAKGESPIAMNCIDGIREPKTRALESVQLPAQQVRACVPSALEWTEFDMGIHRGGEHSDCAALSGGEQTDRRAGWPAYHGR